MANYLTLSWKETHSKDGDDLAREGLSILFLQELSIAEPSKGQQPSEYSSNTKNIHLHWEIWSWLRPSAVTAAQGSPSFGNDAVNLV